MKRLVICVSVIFVLFVLGGCKREPSSDKLQRQQTEASMKQMNAQVGMPNIVNYQQKKLMKLIYELNDKADLINYAYIKSDYQGKLMFIGKCIGYGIPFSAQYTNPDKIAASYSSGGFAILPQADPNGLFMPVSSSATWLMMINPKTKEPSVVYFEPELVVSPFPLHQVPQK